MASGDSRRSSKGKKLGASHSSNEDEVQWLLSDNETVVNPDVNTVKTSKSSSHHNFSNVVYNGTPLIEALVARDEARKRMLVLEEVFSEDLSLPRSRSVSSSNFPVSQPSYSDFTVPLSPHNNVENQSSKLKKEECMKDMVFSEDLSLPRSRSVSSSNFPVLQPSYSDFTVPLSPHNNVENQSSKLKKEECMKDMIPRAQQIDRNVDEINCKSNRLVEKKQSKDKLIEQQLEVMKLRKKISDHSQRLKGYQEKYLESLNIGVQATGSSKLDIKHDEVLDQPSSKNNPPLASQNQRIQPHFSTDNSFTDLSEPPQTAKALLSCVDSIRKQTYHLDHPQDVKNKIESNPEEHDSSNIGQQQGDIELERKKMKNILVELEEKNMMNQELIRKLAQLQLQEESNLGPVRASSNSVSKLVPQTKKRTDVPTKSLQRENKDGKKRNMCTVPSTKRDNVRKELNSAFPARRHYEAEGRANEDPVAPNIGVPSAMKPLSQKQLLYLSQSTFDKIRQIQCNTSSVSELKDVLFTYLEQEGSDISERTLNSQLDEIIRSHRISPAYYDIDEECEFEREEESRVEEDENSEEIDKRRTEIKIIVTPSSAEINDIEEDQNNFDTANICEKLHYLDSFVRKIGYVVHNLYGHLLNVNDKPDGLDAYLKNTQGLVQSLSTHFTEHEEENGKIIINNDNAERSSGEGSYIANKGLFSVLSGSENLQSAHSLNRNSKYVASSSDHCQSANYVQNVSRRENPQLTQQNIASLDSHHRGLDRNLQKKDFVSRKKENNLSDKMGRFRFQSLSHNSLPEQQSGSKENLDSMSLLSSDFNHSNHGDTERKTILDILRRDKKSEKVYDRFHDGKVGNYSTVELEPCDSLSSFPATASMPIRCVTSQTLADENDIAQGQRSNPGTSRTFTESRPKVQSNTRTQEANRRPNDYSSVPLINEMHRERYAHVLPSFLQQLQRQVDQLTELFHRSVPDAELIHPNPNQSYHQSSNQNINSIPSVQTVPVPHNPYNQQLLLCLTQCYHTMYLQQLEIQQLQHTLQHGISAEVYHPANSMSAHASSESIGIHPYGFATWLNPVNVTAYPHETQPSASLSPSGMFSEYDYYPSLVPEFAAAVPTPLPHCHNRPSPIPNDEKPNGETLNNQVPPRTRANNFLDNFRSYSRLNLLSASTNVKRNESQQIQTDPLGINESSHYSQDDNHADRSTAENDRSTRDPESPLNAELQAFRKRSKKANADSTASLNVAYRSIENQKKISLSNINSDSKSLTIGRHSTSSREASFVSVPHSSSINVIHSQSKEESKLGKFSPILPSSSLSTAPDMPTSEFLVNLYREAKLLTNDMERHNALKLIHDIVLSDKSENDLSAQNKVRNDCVILSSNNDKNSEVGHEPSTETTETNPILISDPSNEVISNQSALENSASWISQPSTSISSPLKYGASTGAVRKKPKAQKSNIADSLPISNTFSREKVTRENGIDETSRVYDADYPSYVVNVIIPELRCFLQNWFTPSGEGIFTAKVLASLNAFIVSKVANYLKMPPEHYTSLYNVIEMSTATLCGKKFADWETKYIDHISHFLYECATSFISTGQLPLTLSAYSFDEMECRESPIFFLRSCRYPVNQNVEVPWSEVEVSSELMPHPNEALFYSFQPNNTSSNYFEQSEKTVDTQAEGTKSSVGDIRNNSGRAENEPEMEIGTEADLAEADQSPSQQGNVVTNSSPANICSFDSNSSFNTGVFASANSVSVLNDTDIETQTEIPNGTQYCSDANIDVYPDDIPTKLCPILDEEQGESPPVFVSPSEDAKDEVSSSADVCDLE